jgi:hypothetical protein
MLIWSGWRYLRNGGSSSSYRGALIISSVLVLIQGIFGMILWLGQLRPERGNIHLLYGVIGVIGIPFVLTLLKDRRNRLEMLIFSFLYLFLIGIVYRAIATG